MPIEIIEVYSGGQLVDSYTVTVNTQTIQDQISQKEAKLLEIYSEIEALRAQL
jgi:hypothetical protein